MKHLLVIFGLLGILSASVVYARPVLAPLPAPQPQAGPTALRERWTATSRIYQNGAPNKFILDSSVGASNYKAPWKGVTEWTEIVPGWMPASTPWDWQSQQAEYDVRALSDITGGQIIEWAKDGSYVRLQPMALQWTNDLDQIEQISMPQGSSTFSLVDRTIKWTGAYGVGIDLSWRLENVNLRKMLDVAARALPAPAQYILDGGNPQLELNFIFAASTDLDLWANGVLWNKKDDLDTQVDIEFRRDGAPWFYFRAPTANDADGFAAPTPTIRLKKQGSSLYISVRTSKAWLDTAVYPVTIDPTLDLQVGASSDDGREKKSDSSMSIVSALVLWSHSSNDADRYYVGARWVNGDLSQGDTIDVAYVSFWGSNGAFDDVDYNVHFEDGAAPATYTTGVGDISGRSRTTAFYNWDVNTIPTGQFTNSGSIVSVLQEVVDDHDPTALAMVGVPKTTVTQQWLTDSYDQDTSHAPKLHVEYTTGAPGVRRILIIVGAIPIRQFEGCDEDKVT